MRPRATSGSFIRSARLWRWVFLGLTAFLALVFARVVDLTPPIEGSFFFATDDPEFQADRRIAELFPTDEQIILAVGGGDIQSLEYGTKIHVLSLSLLDVDGVVSVRDIRHGPDDLEDAFESPLWRRLLIDVETNSTNLIVSLREADYETIVPAIEDVIAAHNAPGFEIAISGVPYVVYQIQRLLARDLRVFSLVALAVFTVLLAAFVASGQILVGAIAAALAASMATLILLEALGIEAGILIANTAIIVFVMTISHVRFLIAEWREIRGDSNAAVMQTLRHLWWPSFWTMVTALLGFMSLLLTTAKPIRQFGVSSLVGAVVALACAFLVFPPFLAGARIPGRERWAGLDTWMRRQLARRHYAFAGAVVVFCLVALPGLARLDTDPSLMTYFDAGSPLRDGLERIDRSGGSSPLEFVIRDTSRGRLDDDDVYERMWALQQDLEKDPAVGAVLSLPVIMAEADRAPLAFLLSWEGLVDRLEDPKHDRIAQSFITKDRRHGRFILRMREVGRDTSRADIVERLEGVIRKHHFDPILTGGLYQLQSRLADQVATSLVRGMAGLLVLFGLVSFVVSRSLWVSAAMITTLSIVSAGVYGLAGHLRIPLDIISAAAADLAIAVSIDDMIHLVSHARRRWRETPRDWSRWVETRIALWQPIAASSIIVSSGFGLFLLSSIPPTQRLGLFVLVGTVLWIFLVLLVFPLLATISIGLERRSPAAAGRQPRAPSG